MANLRIPRNLIDRIPADLRAELLAVLEEADQTEQSFDVFMDFSAKDAEHHVQEIIFLKSANQGVAAGDPGDKRRGRNHGAAASGEGND